MSNNLRSNNLKDPYLSYLKSDVFNKKFIEKCNFLLPQFLLKDPKNIQSYYKVKLNVENFKQSYKNLKEFLKNNEHYLLANVNNLDLDLSIKNNILLSKLGKSGLKSKNPFEEKKGFILGLKEFKKKKVLYRYVNTSLFLKVLNDFLKSEDRYIFVKFYSYFNGLKNKILKFRNIIGIMCYQPLFNVNTHLSSSSKKKDSNKINYVLLNNNVNNINHNKSSKNINQLMDQYKRFYEPYNYKASLKIIESKVLENYKLYVECSEKLDKKNYKNLFELLILIVDMEYYLIQILLHYQLLFNLEMLYKQDVQIKSYITRNMLNFETFSSSFNSVFSTGLPSSKSLTIPDYSFNSFFNENKTNINKTNN